MALDLTSAAAEWKSLLSIALDAKTVRAAATDVTLDDGTIYDTRITSMSPLQRSAGAILDPRVPSPYLEVEFNNADGLIRTDADDNEFGARTVTLQVGQGDLVADFSTVFIGTVRFPGGVSYWDDLVLRVEVDDARAKDSTVLPANLLDPLTYLFMETKSYYLPIPILYGDWRTTAGGGETVVAYQIDSTEGTGGRFKICGHAIPPIEAVYLNGVSKAFTAATGDLDIGEFVLDVAYAPATDTITVNCQGSTVDGLRTGVRLDTLPNIYNDILQTHMSVASGSIDATAVASWNAALGTDEYGRRWIGAEISTDDLIRDLLVDGFADQNISGGKYTPVYREVSAASSLPNFAGSEIRPRGDGQKAFSVRRDPERTYANEIVGDYRYAPVDSEFAVTYTRQKAAAITQLGSTKRRRLALNWLYQTGGAERRVTREVVAFSDEVEMLSVTLDPNAMTLEPTDQFRFIYSKYALSADVGTPFQVRSIALDFRTMSAQVQAWNMDNITPGRWSATTAPVWSAATTAERNNQGFWCDSGGLADPANANSGKSIWF